MLLKNLTTLLIVLVFNCAHAKITIIAHRGASMEAPENTKSSILGAAELGAPYIEFDIRMTKDKVPVIIHDADVVKEGKNFLVKDLTLEELRSIDLGSWFLNKYQEERILTLEELLRLDCKDSALMIEIKPIAAPFEQDLETIIAVVKEHGGGKKLLLGCKSAPILSYLKEKHLEFALAAISQSEMDVERQIKIRPEVMVLRHQLLTKERIKALHEKGIEVWGWTIDDLSYTEELKERGLDGVVTNDVARFLRRFLPN